MFIDFDGMEWNIRLYDVCYFLFNMYCRISRKLSADFFVSHFDIWLEIFRGFIRGYDKAAKFSHKEITSIPKVLMVVGVELIAFVSSTSSHEQLSGFITCINALYDNKYLIETSASINC